MLRVAHLPGRVRGCSHIHLLILLKSSIFTHWKLSHLVRIKVDFQVLPLPGSSRSFLCQSTLWLSKRYFLPITKGKSFSSKNCSISDLGVISVALYACHPFSWAYSLHFPLLKTWNGLSLRNIASWLVLLRNYGMHRNELVGWGLWLLSSSRFGPPDTKNTVLGPRAS